MATRIQSTDTSTAITLAANDVLYVARDADVLVIGADGISGAVSATVDVYGNVFGNRGVNIGGVSSTTQLLVSQGASVTGGPGFEAVAMYGNHSLTNYGQIHGDGASAYGVHTYGTGSIYNFGDIFGFSGIVEAGAAGTMTYLYNFGTIVGTALSFSAASSLAVDHVLNTGTMIGDVRLSSGNGNVFDSRLGEVYGAIEGGGRDDTIFGGTNGGTIRGFDGNDVLAATGTFAFTLDGDTGADALYGAAGDDILIGGAGVNQLWGGAGSDTASYEDTGSQVQANLTALYSLVGGAVRDTYNSVENLIGGSGNDVLVGDGEANRLTGGLGADQLYGFAGADTFVYRMAAESRISTGYDTIADFQTGIDKLDLSAFHIDPSKVTLNYGGGSTALYADTDPATAGTELAISFINQNAIKLTDIIF